MGGKGGKQSRSTIVLGRVLALLKSKYYCKGRMVLGDYTPHDVYNRLRHSHVSYEEIAEILSKLLKAKKIKVVKFTADSSLSFSDYGVRKSPVLTVLIRLV